MNRALIALGANLGKPEATFARALEQIGAFATLTENSGLWRSPAWPPGSGAPDYVNAVIAVTTALEPIALMEALLDVETRMGRTRTTRNAPRPIDLDLIAYENRLLSTDHLTLPHPRMQDRAFVLLPLSQVAPNWVHPLTGQGVDHLIARLPLSETRDLHFMGPMLASSGD